MILKPTQIFPNGETVRSDMSIEIKWKNNGDIMTGFTIVAENNANGEVLYNTGFIASYSKTHIIAENTFSSGLTLRCKITVFNSNGESATSDYFILKTATPPTATLLTDGIVRNQIFSAFATYSQINGVGLKCYKFILRDQYGKILEESTYLYDDLLHYDFNTILIDGETYLIECIVVSQDGIAGSSGLIEVVSQYDAPAFQFKLNVENSSDKPHVDMSWATVRLLGKTSGDIAYINNEFIDLTNGAVLYDEGVSTENDFSLKFWVQSAAENKDLLEVNGEYGNITVKVYDNRLHVFKFSNGLTAHISTAQDQIFSTGGFVAEIKQINNNLQIEYEVIANE